VNYFYELESINASQREEVGEKAIALQELKQEGFPVPPTIVVGTQGLASLFSEEEGFGFLSQFKFDLNSYQTLQQTAQSLEKEVSYAELENQQWYNQLYQTLATWNQKTLILRPSLISPFSQLSASSLLESQCCLCEKKALKLALKQVWQSFFYAHNLFYWKQQQVSWEKLGLAVIIQPIKSAIASGTLETTEKKWFLKAVRGLGHGLVRGEVLPERYEINSITKNVEVHQLGYQTRLYHLDPLLQVASSEKEAEKAILTPEQLSQLTEVATRLQGITNQNFFCEWTLVYQDQQNNSSQLYLIQFSEKEASPVEKQVVEKASSSLILKGIGSAGGKVKGKVYVAEKNQETDFPFQGILVTKSITLENLPLLKLAGGLIMELGGMTSHGAILARELHIPAVVGVKGAVDSLAGVEAVIVDGDKGEILRVSDDEEMAVEKENQEAGETSSLATQLMVNVSQRDRAVALSQSAVDGVGLLRSELMLLELLQEQSLSVWLSSGNRDRLIQRLASVIGDFAKAFFPRPIFYRSTDWISLQPQESSLSGERGTYSYVRDSDFFATQMFALRSLQDQGWNNINLILPFVRRVEEVQFCKTLLTEIGVKKSCQLWMMAEVPSVVYLLRDYIEAGIEGIAIGTNDLTQLFLGVDRDQGEFQEDYNENHPAMLALLKELIEKAKAGGIPCSICGQGVVLYPELVKHLVRWGITSISVEESGIPKVRNAIARSEKQIILEAARQQLP